MLKWLEARFVERAIRRAQATRFTCAHAWLVVGVDEETHALSLSCPHCMSSASVCNPTDDEYELGEGAHHAEWPWTDADRVTWDPSAARAAPH